MSHLTLSMLGTFEANLEGNPIKKFRTNKVQALLIYLAVEPITSHPRAGLLELFWPGLPVKSARVNLRQTAYQLRKAIPDLMLTDYKTMGLNPDYPLEVDSRSFSKLLSQVQAHEHSHLLTCDPCHGLLRDAVDLYRGPFLADFWLDDSDLFEDWAMAKRETFRRQVLDALDTLTTAALRSGSYGRAESYARRQLEIDDLRESAHRQLMEALVRSGRREEALAQYERCQSHLRKELGMAPSALTTALYGRIVAGEVDHEAPTAPSVRGYELLEEIGVGAFGAVHKAYQPAVERQVAVKIILPQYANRPEFIRRFEVEAQTVARLEHPFIVPLYDYWREPNGAYLVMRYLQGGSLTRSLAAGESWTGEKAARLLEQVASALETAHRQGVVHRDIKPANILLDQEGNAYLSDFGIAKDILSRESDGDEGAVAGSPAYFSPEHILDEPLTAQSDIYSLGLVLYEMLAGELAYPETSMSALLHKQLNEPVPLLMERFPKLPPDVDAVIQRATAKRPADRYADALELARAFKEALAIPLPAVWAPSVPDEKLVSPYKGLRAFQEADAGDFFGREALVHQLVDRMGEGSYGSSMSGNAQANFLAVVGSSGSGKSSVVKAGLIPALRNGALPGSEKWFIVEMAPGKRPLEELEVSLLPVAIDPPVSLLEPLEKDQWGLIRTLKRILPAGYGDPSQLLLVVDQFEELFTLVEDEDERNHFIDSLLAALDEPRSPLHVLITLRADFYDRPLAYQRLGELLRARTELVLPMSHEELERAIGEPATRAGAAVEPGLIASIIADVQEQPGMLPLFQYALTELFERRQDGRLTQEAYREIGGVAGALGRRAEEIFTDLGVESQSLTRQLFLRLVTLGEGKEDTRRRVHRYELETLDTSHQARASQPQYTTLLEPTTAILSAFGQARLLSFDRDPVTREPTVEVAHEALLREWERLHGWLDDSRSDVSLQRLLGNAAAEWLGSDRDPGFLLRGSRLTQFEDWAAETDLILTKDERVYLEASLAERRKRKAAEAERQAHEAELEHRSRNRLRALVGVFAVAALIAIGLSIFAFDRQNAAQENEALAVQGQATATVAQGEALNQAATAEAERFRAEDEAVARATQQAIAEEQTSLTKSRELAAQSQILLDREPDLSLLLALQAMDEAETNQAASALHQAIMNHRLVRTIKHPEEIMDLGGVALSPDGKNIATAGFDGFIRIFNIESGEELDSWRGHSEAWFIIYSSDGKLLASTGVDGLAKVWDIKSGQELLSVEGTINNDNWPVGFSPDGSLLVSPTSNGTAKVWEIKSGTERLTLKDKGGRILGVAFSPGGTLLATMGDNNHVKLWDAQSGRGLLTFDNEFNWTAIFKFSPRGSFLVANGNTPNSAKVFEISDAFERYRVSSSTPLRGSELFTLIGHDSNVVGSAFNQDESLLATAGQDGKIKVWDMSNGQEIMTLASGVGAVNGVAISQECAKPPDFPFEWCGRYLISSHGDGSLRIWDISPVGGQEVATVPGFMGFFNEDGSVITAYDFECDGTGCWFSEGRNWQLSNNETQDPNTFLGEIRSQIIDTFEIPKHEVGASGFKPYGWSDECSLLGVVYSDKQLILYNANNGEILTQLSVANQRDEIQSFAFSPECDFFATGDENGTVFVWNADSGEVMLTLNDHNDAVDAVSFSPDGSRLLTGSQDGTAKIWDLNSGEVLQTLVGHTNWVRSVDFNPDGTIAATGSRDTTARMWDVNSGAELAALRGHSATVVTVDFSPDGTMLATSSHSDDIKIWESGTGREIMTISNPEDRELYLEQMSPDGSLILARSSAEIWDRLHVLALPENSLRNLARSQLTRWFTTDECQQYFNQEQCPDPRQFEP